MCPSLVIIIYQFWCLRYFFILHHLWGWVHLNVDNSSYLTPCKHLGHVSKIKPVHWVSVESEMQRRLKRTGSLSIIHAAKWNGAGSPVTACWCWGSSVCKAQDWGVKGKKKTLNHRTSQNEHCISKQWTLDITDRTLWDFKSLFRVKINKIIHFQPKIKSWLFSA